MHTDDDFLRKLLDNPADDTPRLVYADWLDEQGDATSKTKAEFLRLECRMAALPERSLNRVRWVKKLQGLAAQLDPHWLAVVSHPRLEECRVRFQFECPKQWEKLTATDDVKVRHCETCRRNVHYCDTLQDARRHAAAGECVAVSLALARRPNDITPPRLVTAGVVLPTEEMIERLGGVTTVTLGGVSDVGSPSRPVEGSVPTVTSRDSRHTSKSRPRRQSRRQNRNISAEEWEDE